MSICKKYRSTSCLKEINERSRTYSVSTGLWSCTGSAAWRWHCSTWYWRVDDFCTALTAQLIKTHLPTRWTFSTVTRLFTFMTSTRQLVYARIQSEVTEPVLTSYLVVHPGRYLHIWHLPSFNFSCNSTIGVR